MKLAILSLGLYLISSAFPSTCIAQTDDTIYSLADEQPSYPGGMMAFFKYIQSDMNYPETAISKGIQGRVFVEYVVEKDGSISNTRVLKSLEPSCDKEALRLLSSSAVWTPGKIDGKVVRVKMALPLNFKLPK